MMQQEDFFPESDCLETSQEIIDAMFKISRNNQPIAKRIWESPTNEEFIAIWEIVTNNGLHDSRQFVWGNMGSKWENILTEGFLGPCTCKNGIACGQCDRHAENAELCKCSDCGEAQWARQCQKDENGI